MAPETTLRKLQRKVWHLLEDSQSSYFATMYASVSMFGILACVVLCVVAVLFPQPYIPSVLLALEVPFVVELALRLARWKTGGSLDHRP